MADDVHPTAHDETGRTATWVLDKDGQDRRPEYGLHGGRGISSYRDSDRNMS